MSNSLWLHELQQRLLCPSLAPWVCLNSCPLSQWCHPTISSSVIPISSCPQSFPAIRVFSNESALRIRWPKCWSLSFSISPSNEYSGWYPLGLIALLSLQSKGLFRSSPAPQFKSINSSALSLLYGPTLTSIHDHWKNHSSDYTLCLCQQTDDSAF